MLWVTSDILIEKYFQCSQCLVFYKSAGLHQNSDNHQFLYRNMPAEKANLLLYKVKAPIKAIHNPIHI